MKRNKKFYKEKELRKLEREVNSAFDNIKNKGLYEVTSYRYFVSKKDTPKAIYNDLKALLELIHKKTYTYDPNDHGFYKHYNMYRDTEIFKIVYYDPLLNDVTEAGYANLPAAQRVMLTQTTSYIPVRYHENHQWKVKEVKEHTYRLHRKYTNYLYVDKIKEYRKTWNWNTDSEYSKLRNKMSRDHLWCKLSRLHGNKTNYREDPTRKFIRNKDHIKQIICDIEELYSDAA